MIRKSEEGIAILRLFTEALGEYVCARLSDLPEKPVASFALPGGIRGQNALNLYFCALAEDADLRSNEKEFERVGDAWVSLLPPLRLKCTYIVSAWPDTPDPEEAALVQIRLLSRACAVFAASGNMPAAYLPAELNTAGLPKPLVSLIDHDLPKRPDFWSLAGCAFHPSFSLSATISIPIAETSYDHIVEELQIKYINGLTG